MVTQLSSTITPVVRVRILPDRCRAGSQRVPANPLDRVFLTVVLHKSCTHLSKIFSPAGEAERWPFGR